MNSLLNFLILTNEMDTWQLKGYNKYSISVATDA